MKRNYAGYMKIHPVTYQMMVTYVGFGEKFYSDLDVCLHDLFTHQTNPVKYLDKFLYSGDFSPVLVSELRVALKAEAKSLNCEVGCVYLFNTENKQFYFGSAEDSTMKAVAVLGRGAI